MSLSGKWEILEPRGGSCWVSLGWKMGNPLWGHREGPVGVPEWKMGNSGVTGRVLWVSLVPSGGAALPRLSLPVFQPWIRAGIGAVGWENGVRWFGIHNGLREQGGMVWDGMVWDHHGLREKDGTIWDPKCAGIMG